MEQVTDFLLRYATAHSLAAVGLLTLACGCAVLVIVLLHNKKDSIVLAVKLVYHDRRHESPMPNDFVTPFMAKELLKEFTAVDKKGYMLHNTSIQINYGYMALGAGKSPKVFDRKTFTEVRVREMTNFIDETVIKLELDDDHN